MSQHNAFDFALEQFSDYTSGGCIRQVAMPRLYTLFYRPGSMDVVLQELFIVIGFDHERVNLSQTLS
jgi:hypothetical protein